MFGHMYHEIGNMFATYQERSWITQVGINLEDGVVLPRVIQTEQVGAEISLDRVLRNRDVSTDHSHQNRSKAYCKFKVELASVLQLGPTSGSPNLLPSSISIRSSSDPAMNQTGGGGLDDLVFGVRLCSIGDVLRKTLDGRIVRRECITRVETDEMGEMTMGVVGRVHINFPFWRAV